MIKLNPRKFFLLYPLLLYVLYVNAAPQCTMELIRIDQFGYQTNAQKIAVISDPQTGFNASKSYSPGTNFEIRDWTTDATVYSGTISAWNGGAEHAQSGDIVWWFDFSSVTTPGNYYVYDVANDVGSYRFEIHDNVYLDVLKQATRTFYYQRCGTPKAVPFAASAWSDASCHIGGLQDLNCRLYNDAGNAATEKDLSGGWHDAGDYNKYVNFVWSAVIDMLLAYEENPTIWSDDYNIPESGNGIPDLLDEVKYELDWILKMQQGDGSVLSVVGGGSSGPPSSDGTQRVYGPENTSSTLTAAGLFALAAIQFNAIGETAYASTLQTAAVNAWDWANANPNVTFSNSGLLAAGEQEVDDYGRLSRKVAAAVFLYALTTDTKYRDTVDNRYDDINMIQWGFTFPFQSTQQDMLLYYTKLGGATAGTVTAINNAYSNSTENGGDNLSAHNSNADAYIAHISDGSYTWGSNRVKCHQGLMYANMNTYGLDAPNSTNYTNAAQSYINYIHGVNPTGFCYLSNMSSYGAENSINEFYHNWFYDGSALWDRAGTSTYGPAPGFLPGGPNRNYDWDGCCPSGCGSPGNNAMCTSESLEPPKNQPEQKSYKDWNTSWPQNSWEVTENSDSYQAAYIRLLSHFIADTLGGPSNAAGAIGTTCTSTGLNENKSLIAFELYPNPFNASIDITFTVKQDQELMIRIVDGLGKPVKVFKKSSFNAGTHTLQWNGESDQEQQVSSGLYFLIINSDNQITTRKIVRN